MNVLIISYYFSPINRIASVRMSKVAYLLAKQGHQVNVICYDADKHEKEDIAKSELIGDNDNLHINRIKWNMDALSVEIYYNALALLNRKHNNRAQEGRATTTNTNIDFPEEEYTGRGLKVNVANSVMDRLYKIKNKYMAEEAENTVKSLQKKGFYPDLIIASYEPLVSLLVGKKCKKIWPESTLIYDFRDVMTNHYYGMHKGLYEDRVYKRLLSEEEKLLSECDVITVVSEGQKKMIMDRQRIKYGDKIHVVYNGFDNMEVAADKEKTENKQISIVFTGTLQPKKRIGFVYLLRTIKEMLADKQIKPSQINIKYAGHNATELSLIANELGVADIMDIYDHLPREEAMYMQTTADFLLNLVWNEQYDQGILGGKFGEYMANRKPILGIVSGNLSGSDLYEEIYKRGIGECFEIVRGEAETERLKQFILDYISGEKTYNYDDRAVDDFNYDMIAKKFLSLCSKQSLQGKI